MPVHLKILICTFSFSYNPLLTQQCDNMYVYLKFGENWTANMGDMEKIPFVQFLLLSLLLFFSLNPSISKP